MADVLAEVTDIPNRFGQLGVRRAIEVNDPATPSVILDTFGRCPRQNGCSSVAVPSLSLRQSLLLIGGGIVEEKVSHQRGYLSSLLNQDPAPALTRLSRTFTFAPFAGLPATRSSRTGPANSKAPPTSATPPKTSSGRF